MPGGGNARASLSKIATVVAAYFVVSISLVFVNKWLLSADSSTIPAPLFVTWYQCVVTVLICWALGRAGRDAAPGEFLAQFPVVQFRLPVAQRVMPLSVVFVGMMTFNNLCIKYVEVSFYNVARSLTICFNVALTYAMLGKKTSRATMVCLGVVVLGFYLGTDSEINFSMIGTVFGVTSSLFVSLNSIYTSKVIDAVEGDKWRLSAYNNINACFLFVPFILVSGEVDIVLDHAHLLLSPSFWFMMTLSGVFGFLIGICTIMQIQVTSPLTHNISGTAKSGVQTVLAFMIWKNPTSFQNVLGIFMTLGGSLLYTWVRTKEMRAAEAAEARASRSLEEMGRTLHATAGEGGGGGKSRQELELASREEVAPLRGSS